MKKTMKRFLTSALSTFAIATSLASLDAAFVEETPTTAVDVSGVYTGVYRHSKASIKVGETLFPLEINITLEPDSAKTKLTITCNGDDGNTRYISGIPGNDRPKSFPTFLESDPNNLLQLEDPALALDKKKTFNIITTYHGMPVVFN